MLHRPGVSGLRAVIEVHISLCLSGLRGFMVLEEAWNAAGVGGFGAVYGWYGLGRGNSLGFRVNEELRRVLTGGCRSGAGMVQSLGFALRVALWLR